MPHHILVADDDPHIREVIAFPKTAQAVDLMSGAPSSVDDRQLRDLRLKTTVASG